jgi:prepilin-type N-terminal cleavage/methylation domain-containing protein
MFSRRRANPISARAPGGGRADRIRWSVRRHEVAPGGFTLVEVMVGMVIISMLAALAVPALRHIQRKAKSTAIANDFRVFGAAFDTYAQETGTWPADTAIGVFPPVMAQRINSAVWLRKTPMGGKYNWEKGKTHRGLTYAAAIAIGAATGAPLPLDTPQLQDLEHTIDSPRAVNWNTGSFRLGSGTVPLFVIQQ